MEEPRMSAGGTTVFSRLTRLVVIVLVVGCLFALSWIPPLGRGRARSLTTRTPSQQCQLQLSDGVITVGEEAWFELGSSCVRHDNGSISCANPEYIKEALDSQAEESSFVDGMGTFVESNALVGFGNEKYMWELAVRRYLDTHNQNQHILLFQQTFGNTVHGTALPNATSPLEAANDGLASWFPSFRRLSSSSGRRLRVPETLGVVRYAGKFTAQYDIQAWGEENNAQLKEDGFSALESGPLVVFSRDCAVVMSSASSFMSSGMVVENGQVEFGPLGSITSLPGGHSTSMIMSASPIQFPQTSTPDGIRRAMDTWGSSLQQKYALHSGGSSGRRQRLSDVTVEHLQFSTDAGAYYYYHTLDDDINYEQTIKHIKQVAKDRQIPIGSWLMDSWWYPKDDTHGVTEWVANPDMFPDGVQAVQRDPSLPYWHIMAHNRYFSAHTTYAKANGGKYNFLLQGKMALPLEQVFWYDLFVNASNTWGLTTYEQDWLYTSYRYFDYLLQNVDTARTWLLQMGQAAQAVGIPIQYCMTFPNHLLQSLEIPAVTQARASGDYHPSIVGDNWEPMGITSMLVSALGLFPTKDSFWSYGGWENYTTGRIQQHREKSPNLHSIISTFSTGQVAPSDKIELLNLDLVMRSCDAAGRLLKPDKPLVTVDESLLAEVGMATTEPYRPQGKVWSTYSSLADGLIQYTYILSAGAPSWIADVRDIYPSENVVLQKSKPDYVAWFSQTTNNETKSFVPMALPVEVPLTTTVDIRLLIVAPALKNGWVFLGEAETKWVAVSQDRFSNFILTKSGFSMNVRGKALENVRLFLRDPDESFYTVECLLGASGTAHFSSSSLRCTEFGEYEKDTKTVLSSVVLSN